VETQNGNRWFILAAGVIMLLFAGIIYGWSILNAPLRLEFGWDPGAMGLNFTITMCFFCIGGILGGIAAKKYSPKVILLAAAVTVFAGFAITSGMRGHILALYVAYGIMCGIGIGVAYNIVISTVLGWFPDKRGTASGILLLGFGSSALVLGPLMKYMFDAVGWRHAYLALAAALLVVLAAGAFCVKRNVPKSDGPTAAAKNISDAGEPIKSVPTKEMMRLPSFWKFYVFGVLIGGIGVCIISFARDISVVVGASANAAVLFVGVLSISNGFGRIISGWLFDAFGRFKTILAIAVSGVLAVSIMLLSLYLGSVPLLAAGLIAVGLTYGALPTLIASFISAVYGAKYFAVNFSVGTTVLIPASFMSAAGGNIISATGSYIPVLFTLLVFSAVNFIISLYLRNA